MKPLAIIPSFVSEEQDRDVLWTAVTTLRDTTSDALDVLVVDDASPAQGLMDEFEEKAWERHAATTYRRDTNEGFARTVNVGLETAREGGRDAILINSDIEFHNPHWLDKMTEQRAPDGSEPGIVGARLLYPNNLIQHGGIYFSMLHRCFEHIHKYAPHDLPEALVPKVCPVTGALQYIRHSTLQRVGLYDEDFRMGWEDVDYGVRAWLDGIVSVYCPAAVAMHHEGFTRFRKSSHVEAWIAQSWAYFCRKYATQSFAAFVPSTF